MAKGKTAAAPAPAAAAGGNEKRQADRARRQEEINELRKGPLDPTDERFQQLKDSQLPQARLLGKVPEAYERLVEPHVASFDFFLEEGMQMVVDSLPAFEVRPGRQGVGGMQHACMRWTGTRHACMLEIACAGAAQRAWGMGWVHACGRRLPWRMLQPALRGMLDAWHASVCAP